MVASRELRIWPNGVQLCYKQQFWCGHIVTIFSNRKNAVKFSSREPTGSPVDPDLHETVLEMGCIKCAEPCEPLDYQHKGRGGFLKNLPAPIMADEFIHW